MRHECLTLTESQVAAWPSPSGTNREDMMKEAVDALSSRPSATRINPLLAPTPAKYTSSCGFCILGTEPSHALGQRRPRASRVHFVLPLRIGIFAYPFFVGNRLSGYLGRDRRKSKAEVAINDLGYTATGASLNDAGQASTGLILPPLFVPRSLALGTYTG